MLVNLAPRHRGWLLAVLVLLFLGIAEAKTTADTKPPEPRTMLIEPGDIEKKLKQPGVRILDTRPLPDYAKGHLPGAIRVDVKRWQDLGKKEGGFQDAKGWGEKVGQLGISHDSQVIVYGSNPPDTARIWWTLKYLGHQNVTILNGGWELWNKEKRPADTASPNIEAVKFDPKFQTDRLEEIDSLKKSVQAGKITVVDTRTTDEFTGKEVRGKRGGHIPGAKHLEWKELLAEDGRFKSSEQLRELFKQRGIQLDQTAVCYCQSGGRASVEAFALELAGYPKVKVFMRSWEQWSADPDAPVEGK